MITEQQLATSNSALDKVAHELLDPEIRINMDEVLLADDPLQQFQVVINESRELGTYLLVLGFKAATGLH